MATNFETSIGKIYCAYNKNTDEFEKIRVIDIASDNNKLIYTIAKLDKHNHIIIDSKMDYDEEHMNHIRKDCILLRSAGYISVSNIISVKGTHGKKDINDVLLIFFPNNSYTNIPDFEQPYAIARQGLDNPFADSRFSYEESVGLSVSIDSIPNGYALSDFMFNDGVLSSRLVQTYITDSDQDLAYILHNKETDDILDSMYTHAKNSRLRLNCNAKVDPDCINGYCRTLKDFVRVSGFIGEIHTKLGVGDLDKDCVLEEGKALSDEDKLMVSALYGGIHINKIVPIYFDYDINLNMIKMKYLLLNDYNDCMWIAPYTVSDNEFDANSLYKLTEERTLKLQNRLKSIVNAYDK